MGRVEYTFEDLDRVKQQYRTNFERLMSSVSNIQRKKHQKEESRLVKLETSIQKQLGVFIHGPSCPGNTSHCGKCNKTDCGFRYVPKNPIEDAGTRKKYAKRTTKVA